MFQPAVTLAGQRSYMRCTGAISCVAPSNRIVEDWDKYLALLAFEGKSYRLKEVASRLINAGAA